MTRYTIKSHNDKDDTDKNLTKKDLVALQRVAQYLEKCRLRDYINLLDHPGKWFSINLLGGIARGIGLAIGFTLLGALAIFMLTKIVSWNLPVISSFIAELLEMVKEYQTIRP